ncbi:tripartite tricarboxylate transporter TctB family protein [uncultured Roseibium sp.]|uniref:tripartite tricarboxylate transporter TctB family protein n=1 Tax=uncultured Roseibium sp. TaxID=1936171 RepID=UPI003216BB12
MKHATVTTANLWVGLSLAAFGVAAVFWMIPTYVTGAVADTGQLTPGFMPRVAAWSMVVFGLIVAVSNLHVILTDARATAEESEENEELVFGRNEIVNTVILVLMAAAYVASLTFFGFMVPTVLVLGVTAYFAGYRRPLGLIGFSIGLPLLLEQLLWHVLNIPLPDFPLVNF